MRGIFPQGEGAAGGPIPARSGTTFTDTRMKTNTVLYPNGARDSSVSLQDNEDYSRPVLRVCKTPHRMSTCLLTMWLLAHQPRLNILCLDRRSNRLTFLSHATRLQSINIAPTSKNSLVMIPTCRSISFLFCLSIRALMREPEAHEPRPRQVWVPASALAHEIRRIQKNKSPRPEVKWLISPWRLHEQHIHYLHTYHAASSWALSLSWPSLSCFNLLISFALPLLRVLNSLFFPLHLNCLRFCYCFDLRGYVPCAVFRLTNSMKLRLRLIILS